MELNRARREKYPSRKQRERAAAIAIEEDQMECSTTPLPHLPSDIQKLAKMSLSTMLEFFSEHYLTRSENSMKEMMPEAIVNVPALRSPTSPTNHWQSSVTVHTDKYEQWERYPPYSSKFDSNSPTSSDSFELKSTCKAIHARRMTAQHAFETDRLEQFNIKSKELFLKAVHSDLMRYLKEWKDLETFLKKYCTASYLDMTMGTHLLQWKSLRIVGLMEDLKDLESDEIAFIARYAARWYMVDVDRA